jgi:hypothetical protein
MLVRYQRDIANVIQIEYKIKAGALPIEVCTVEYGNAEKGERM